MARGLLAVGLETGDRVGIWSPNCAEWVLVQYATAQVGAILVNLNPAYRTSELEYALRQSGCRLLMAATELQDQRLPGDDRRGPARAAGARAGRSTSAPELGRRCSPRRATCSDDRLRGPRGRSSSFDDPINIQYTSGTTGFPKGATLTHHNILNNGFFVGEGCAYTEHDRVCIPVPFYHCFGMVMGNLACTTHGADDGDAGAGVRPGGDARRRSRPSAAPASTACPRCSSPSSTCPTSSGSTCRSLRTGIMAGSPCPVEVMKQCRRRACTWTR